MKNKIFFMIAICFVTCGILKFNFAEAGGLARTPAAMESGDQLNSDPARPSTPTATPVPDLKPQIPIIQAPAPNQPPADPAPPFKPVVPVENPWAKVKSPLKGADEKAEVIGFYSKGCIRNAREIAVSNKYWEVVNIDRNRNYGHPDLVEFLKDLGRWSVEEAKLGKLILGDLSQPAGGPMPFGHASHQNGLDVDIRFRMAKLDERLADSERKGFPEKPVAKHKVEKEGNDYVLKTGMIGAEWDVAYAKLLARAAAYPRVQRIFVSPPIKKTLCEIYRPVTGTEYPLWLKKVAPYYGHDAHFHVRLTCPKDSPNCQGQDPIVAKLGDETQVGCAGPAIAWWLESKTGKDAPKESYLATVIADLNKPEPPPPTPEEKSKAPPVNKFEKLPQDCKNLVAAPQTAKSAP